MPSHYVQRALTDVAGLIGRETSDIARGRERRARLGLEEAQLRHGLRRYEELEKPVAEIRLARLREERDFELEPMPIEEIFGGVGPFELTHILDKAGPEFKKIMGSHNAKSGFMEKNGKPFRRMDYKRHAGTIQGIMRTHMDPIKNLEDQEAQLEIGLSQARDPSLVGPMTTELTDVRERLASARENPVPLYQEMLDDLLNLRGKAVDTGGDVSTIDLGIKQTQERIKTEIEARQKETGKPRPPDKTIDVRRVKGGKRVRDEWFDETGNVVRSRERFVPDKPTEKGGELDRITKRQNQLIKSVNLTLKKHGKKSGFSITIDPSTGFTSVSSGGADYQGLVEKAKTNAKAKKDLAKVDGWLAEIDRLIGVPEEAAAPEEITPPDWRKYRTVE